MADVQVTCTTKGQHNHKAITHLGGPGGGGWKWTKKQVIDSINAKSNTFFTSVDGRRADIGVVSDPDGDYLRTHADGVWTDNLLALQNCP